MPDPDTISADYSLRPSELADTLALLIEARQPAIVWGPPGCAKSQIARQVAADAGREYIDVRALLLDPVDLRGIPWRDGHDRTRWAPPAFLPPADGRWLVNLEELPSAVPMVQAALYQLVLDRRCGEYELPDGAALIACGNRETDRGVVHRMPTPLASRFVHLEIRVDAPDWCAWGAGNGIAPEVLFFVQMRPELLHDFDPRSAEKAFPCPRTWESNIVHRRNGLDPAAERALFRGAVGEAAAVEFCAFLKVWRDLPHPRAVIDDPKNAPVPDNASALIALCGSLYRLADDVNLGAIVASPVLACRQATFRRDRPIVGPNEDLAVTRCHDLRDYLGNLLRCYRRFRVVIAYAKADFIRIQVNIVHDSLRVDPVFETVLAVEVDPTLPPFLYNVDVMAPA